MFRVKSDNELLKHDMNNKRYNICLNIFLEILNKHTPAKERYVRAKQNSLMTLDIKENLRKAKKYLHKPFKKN